MKQNHNKEKLFYEHLAKMILEEFIKWPKYILRHFDAPDLINFNGMGIEVTRAIYPGEAEAGSLYNLVVNKKVSEIKESLLKKVADLDYEFLMWKGKVAAVGPREAIWESTKEIEIAFMNKVDKDQRYGEQVELFIFAPSIDYCNFEMIDQFTKWAHKKQESINNTFSKVYIFDYTYLYICDLYKNETKSVLIDKESIEPLIECSIAFAEEED